MDTESMNMATERLVVVGEILRSTACYGRKAILNINFFAGMYLRDLLRNASGFDVDECKDASRSLMKLYIGAAAIATWKAMFRFVLFLNSYGLPISGMIVRFARKPHLFAFGTIANSSDQDDEALDFERLREGSTVTGFGLVLPGEE